MRGWDQMVLKLPLSSMKEGISGRQGDIYGFSVKLQT